MIEAGELYAFLGDMYEQIGDQAAWEFYLSRVADSSFDDWKRGLFQEASASQPASGAVDTSAIIADSLAISNACVWKEVPD